MNDLGVGVPQTGRPGYVQVISGNPTVPAAVIYQITGGIGGWFGAGLDSINIGAGTQELLVASMGGVEVRSSLTGALLLGPIAFPPNFTPVRSLQNFPERFSIRTIGDVNLDGIDDFAVGNAIADQVLILDGSPLFFGTTIAIVNRRVADWSGWHATKILHERYRVVVISLQSREWRRSLAVYGTSADLITGRNVSHSGRGHRAKWAK